MNTTDDRINPDAPPFDPFPEIPADDPWRVAVRREIEEYEARLRQVEECDARLRESRLSRFEAMIERCTEKLVARRKDQAHG